MKNPQATITGWGVFGTASGFLFEGAGSLAISDRDPLNSVLDSQLCRDRFWTRCLSLHRCAQKQDTLIFTIRRPVLDAIGRPGFCAAALAVSTNGVEPSGKKAHARLMQDASALLEELAQRGSSTSQRFQFEVQHLRDFISQHARDFNLAPDSSDATAGLAAANRSAVNYCLDPQTWEELLSCNWLQLGTTQTEANLYFFCSTGKPKIPGLSPLPLDALDALCDRALQRLRQPPPPAADVQPELPPPSVRADTIAREPQKSSPPQAAWPAAALPELQAIHERHPYPRATLAND